jgi:hypothetical protein
MRKRPLPNLNNILLDRLVRTGLLNICFTDRQKQSVLYAAGYPVPSIASPLSDLPLCAVGPIDPSIATTHVIPLSMSFPLSSPNVLLFSLHSFRFPADDQTTDPRSPSSFAPASVQLWTHNDNECTRRSRDQGYPSGVGECAGWQDGRGNNRVWERSSREEYLASPLQRKSRGASGLIVGSHGNDDEEEEFIVERRGTLLDRLRQRV